MTNPYYKKIRSCIRRYGRMIQGVFGDAEHMSFSYTIGNQAKGFPELLVIGTYRGTYLDEMSERMIERGKAFEHGEIIKTHGKYRIKIINATYEAHEKYTIQAGQYYATENYQVQQIILSDEEGRFPGEIGCDPGCAGIPILAAKLH